MSIIVKGINMTKSCYLCPFCDYVSGRCDAVKGTPYTPENRYDQRADWCPLVEAPEWISVEERFPEIDTNVLVYAIGKIDGFIGDTVIAISRRCVFRLFPWNEGIEVWENPWQYFTTDYDVTHWMPLPEPPKEGKP